ncbi:helix-turn-helix domain-containing protein [Microbacterium lacticum]|uniref:Helix-turn-helix protein n=1 Tax=Microbacterium lacticum TaxID=33885 RepID=A0A4Y3ULM7_9MICO|nr:helix-turn-helix transcriptional regulator [Microbacterium lacticum]TQN00449.1 hypothetical protein FHX68_0544 [Microbacterium lacticum]GEB94399.1 hypothetical protein MLA01_06180 [Microbacterium lacticum]GGN17831.1 hypothetical protein GCM10009724_09520 [Microbacterium lacticum]
MLTDEQIGRNLAAWRGDRSQKDLASAMRELGFKWSQATVWSIEKGERPLRLSEAEALAQVMGRSNLHLLSKSDAASDAFAAGSAARDAYETLLASLKAFDAARVNLAFSLDAVAPEDQTGFLRELGDCWIGTSVEDVLEEYRTESLADSVREQLLSGTTDEDLEDIEERQRGTWIARLSEVNRGVQSADGERQAEA